MGSSVEVNPYTATAHSSEQRATSVSILFRVLLVIAALNLLFHGALMAFQYSQHFANLPSFEASFATNFSLAMFLKDCVTGATALLAAILIFCKQRLGWWMAVIHWHWYLTWNALIVIVAELFGWQFPVRYAQAEIASHIAQCVIYSCVALVFLYQKPVLRILNVSIANRLYTLALMIAGTASLGFLINWWSSIR